ncbi:HAD family hydrolase [Paucisalibacillus globulus]|uniref:HAD family hydrolase n=1 Tax=Paucisalibacillus globulus TaxID=351095 RepID=UPI00041A57AD|nr:HAD-IA family hydrolase [Paucisalibacillus globulus]
MNQRNVQTIFFDAGGVLFDTPIKGEERIRNLLTGRGYDVATINEAISKAKQIKTTLITKWDEEEQYYKKFYGTIAKEVGDIGLTNELLYLTHYAVHCELFPEVIDVLEELSGKYKLAIISNAMPSMDWVFDRLGIRKYFDTIILSAFVKEGKPNKAIYEIALNQAQAQREQSIFIDDKLENIDGAEKVGIRGLHLDRSKINLLELLQEEKLLVDADKGEIE